MSSSLRVVQVHQGSVSALLNLSPIPKPWAQWVPFTEGVGKEPLLWVL